MGDIVIVSEQPAGSAKKREVKELEGKGSQGVVTRVGRAAVWVALDGEESEVGAGGNSRRLWIVKLANDATYKRMNQVIGRLGKMKEGEVCSSFAWYRALTDLFIVLELHQSPVWPFETYACARGPEHYWGGGMDRPDTECFSKGCYQICSSFKRSSSHPRTSRSKLLFSQ